MPPQVRMAHYPAFPPAVRPSGVGCIRVAHPSATLNPPKEVLPSDLHVLGLPLAFILSQDQTLRCNIVVLNLFLCVSGSALMFSLVSLLKGSFSLTARPRAAGLVLASDFQRTSALPRLFSVPLSLGKRVQKYNLFRN